MRFYGLAHEVAPVVYVERKTHHEKWTGERSLKARMPLKPTDVQAYLDGKELDLSGMCAARATAGELSAADATKAAALGAEVQGMLSEKRMAPTVRTVYRRVAFQTDLAASVRITFDNSLQLYKEGLPADGKKDGWCTSLDAHVDEQASLRRFPHAILEVKLASDDAPPTWLTELIESALLQARTLTTTCHHPMPSPTFSRLLTPSHHLLH